jgi:two-component system NtrC family sensor kinase
VSDQQGSRMTSRGGRLLLMILAGALAALGGISLYRHAAHEPADLGLTAVSGAGRLEVAPGGPAEAAGVRSGDILIALGGEPFRGPFEWNRRLLESPPPAPVMVEVARGSEVHTFPVIYRRAGGNIYYYLALVGFFFLTTAAVAALRPAWGPLTWRYFIFSASIFSLLAVSDLPAGTTMDWILFVVDRLGRLSFAPLFYLLASAIARRQPQRRALGSLSLWAPPALLGLAGLLIAAGAARGTLRDPLLLWTLKDRAELLAAALYATAGLAVLARAMTRESISHRRYLLRWALWGSLAGFAPIVVLYLIPAGLGVALPWWAELSALSLVLLPVTLSSTLFRFRQGDLELYFKRAFSSLSVFFLTIAAFEAASVLLDKVGGAYLNLSDGLRTVLAAFTACLLYPEIKKMTFQAIDRLVYGGRYSFRKTLLSFGRELNSELDLTTLVEKFDSRVRETLDLSTALVLVRDDRNGVLRSVREDGLAVPVHSPLVERIRGVSYLLLEELLHAPDAERLEGLRSRGVQYLFPMKVEGEVRAVLATGSRRGGESLGTEDVELLVALCGHAAIAIESARLFAALKGKVEEVECLRRYNENILESSRIGILVVGADGAIQALNRALVDIYGATREEAVGRKLSEVFPLPLVRQLARPAADAVSPDKTRSLYRYSLTDRRGRRILVNITLSQLAAPGARHSQRDLGEEEGDGTVITFDDVTEQVRMEERLQRQDRLASIGLLAAGVAHEVNTPLTGISSYTQMLLAELDPSDPRVEVLKKMERQTFRAANIVHSLLNFTRDGSSGVEMIRVGDLVEESLALFEPQLRGGKVKVEKRIEESLPMLPGNRGKLQQVLLNLLLNARDAIPESGTIRINAQHRAGRLVLEVHDDGEGIAEEDLGKIFDPFFTTKPRGRGTGLGLSLSYTIVQEHRGEISVESRRGQGTLFTVDLPFEGRDAVHA